MTTCAGPHCNRTAGTHTGLCESHNRQILRGNPLKPLRQYGTNTPCTGPGPNNQPCGEHSTVKGLCITHDRQRRRGKPLTIIGATSTRNGQRTPCKFGPCDRRGTHKGLCPTHRRQQLKGQPLTMIEPRSSDTKPCANDGCVRVSRARGLCVTCYQTKYRRPRTAPTNGDTPQPRRPEARPSNMPAGWFKTTIRKRTQSPSIGGISHNTIGAPTPTTDTQRAAVDRLIGRMANGPGDTDYLRALLLDITPNQKETAA